MVKMIPQINKLNVMVLKTFGGNIWEWIDGLHTVGTTIYTQDGNFTDNATGAISRGTFAANFAGYISDIWGNR